MRACAVLCLVVAAAAACSPRTPAREYELTGQILAVRPERREVVIKHEDIKGFMPGMTMPFTVKDTSLLTGKQPGDLVTATLVVGQTEAHLSALTATGHAALDAPAPAPVADVLSAGQAVADAALIDQDGKARPFSSFRKHRLVLTFIYTRCPLPDFCPLMDRHFASIQKTIAERAEFSDVRLVTVTLDPAFDRPAILKAYSRRRGADPAVWSFLTGEPADVSRFATQFGLYVEHNPGNPIDITHNLRTAVIDPQGRLVSVRSGNDWTPAELVAELNAAPAPED